MTVSRKQLFSELLNKFLEISNDIEAVIISDEEGLVIAGEKRKNIDIELVSFLTAVVNPVLERFRNEFAFKKFGSANFETEKNRLLFVTIDERTTLSIVLASLASIERLSPYAYFLAEKSAQILLTNQAELNQLAIPNFQYAVEGFKEEDRITETQLETGGEYRFKFIVIGEHEVGKTSIVRRFVEKKFLADYRTTIGLNIMTHNFDFFGNKISLFIWDIGAQEYFKRYRKTYYNGAQAAFIVFDVTKRESYDNIINWYEELTSFKDDDLSIVIVGNKTDLIDQRIIDYEEGVHLANALSEENKIKISYIETSALTGDNVEDAFGLMSYHFITKSKKSREEKLQEEIVDIINSMLKERSKLKLSFLTNKLVWSPVLRLLFETKELGPFSKIDKKNTEIFKNSKGLILKNMLFENLKISDADGVFAILDARNTEDFDPKWNDLVKKIIKHIDDNKVLSIGIATTEKGDWSKITEKINVDKHLEKKLIHYFLFKIIPEKKLEILEQLKVLLNTIQQTINLNIFKN
jgi:Ras-related protein Rab-11A